jgi:hypothetical protein
MYEGNDAIARKEKVTQQQEEEKRRNKMDAIPKSVTISSYATLGDQLASLLLLSLSPM